MRKHFGNNFPRWRKWYNVKNKLAEKLRKLNINTFELVSWKDDNTLPIGESIYDLIDDEKRAWQ